MPTQTPGVESTTRSGWIQAALLLSGPTVAVWWRPSSSGFALFTQAPKEKARERCRDGLDPPRLQKDKAACTGQQLGDGRNLNAAGGG